MENHQDSPHVNDSLSKKKQRHPSATFLAVLGLIILNCVSLIFLIACSSPPPSEPTLHNVIYELTGPEAAPVYITLNNAKGEPERREQAKLPWTIEFDAPEGQLAYVSGQLASTGNEIKCIITIDGRRVQEKVGTGSNSITTCSARIE